MATSSMGSGFAIGQALSAVIGSYYSVQSTKSSLNHQARIADINASLAETNAGLSEFAARQEIVRGQEEAGRIGLRAGQIKSAQRAAMAANGIDLSVGSAAEVQASTEFMRQQDVNTVMANAARSAWGYRVQAINERTQGSNAQVAAMAARGNANGMNPYAAGIGSGLTVAARWYSKNSTATTSGSAWGAGGPPTPYGTSEGE